MPLPASLTIRSLGPGDLALLDGMLSMFGEAFDEQETYSGARPDSAYLERLLNRDTFIAVAALEGSQVVGGLAAYVLHKFERARSEIYIYDLAVAVTHRRRGIATALIRELVGIARERGAWVVFVQADRDDAPAVALYESLGVREDVLHFDIRVEPQRPAAGRGENG